MSKKLLVLLAGIVFILTTNVSTFATEGYMDYPDGEITLTEEFTADSPSFYYDFDDTTQKNGKTYYLKNVSYKVLSADNLQTTEPVIQKINYSNLYEKNVEPPESLTVPKGDQEIEVKLTDFQYTETVITDRKELVTAYTDYDYKTEMPEPTEVKNVIYHDEASKQDIPATLKLKELKEVDSWKWRDDVEIPITFSLYDAEYYVLGDNLIPYNEDKPALEGYEDELLTELNLDTNKYRITSVEWDGEPYTVGEVRYRKAIAHGERYAANYVAVYEDVVALPDVDGYNAVAEYRSEIPELTGETEYTVQATATYTPPVVQETVVEQQETVVEGEPKTVVEEKVVEKPVPVQTPVPLFNGDSSGNNSTTTEIVAIVSTVFAGLLLIVLLAIAILYILSRKRKKKGEERH